ncbi:MAG TPA: DUF4832 domain-containing protein [Terriglobia bacterium]|nr:DUF4832 domain-containing protein [Terriglobia bacterium]
MRWKVFQWAICLTFVATSAIAQTSHVVVRPREIQQVLVNPGMGIQTFQRFNGQTLNQGLKWSEAGPEMQLENAPTPPDFPGSSISYCRWFWSAIEPEPGQFRWNIIDLALQEARQHHQRLAIRIMPYDQKHPLPQWYQDSGARRANKPGDKDGGIWQPDFSDPLYLKDWGELVAAAGKRYDGNPYLDTVDISSVGYWGEGWSPYMPAFRYQKALIDIWVKAFKRTPLLMNFDEQQALTYGTEHGSGWRLDCWGDMRRHSDDPYFPSEMLDIYPQQVVRAGIQNVWERSPVSLESCGVPGSWKEHGYDLDYILAQALRWHVTSVNIKSSAIPPEWKQQFDEFQKKMGYRFILRRLEYPRTVAPGSMAMIHMWWLNAGVAPIYRKYGLALQLQNDSDRATLRLPVDIRKWLPGDAVYDGTVYIPETLKPGSYRLRVGMLDPRTGKPAIRLAIEGRQPDGWYDMGSIKVH